MSRLEWHILITFRAVYCLLHAYDISGEPWLGEVLGVFSVFNKKVTN